MIIKISATPKAGVADIFYGYNDYMGLSAIDNNLECLACGLGHIDAALEGRQRQGAAGSGCKTAVERVEADGLAIAVQSAVAIGKLRQIAFRQCATNAGCRQHMHGATLLLVVGLGKNFGVSHLQCLEHGGEAVVVHGFA